MQTGGQKISDAVMRMSDEAMNTVRAHPQWPGTNYEYGKQKKNVTRMIRITYSICWYDRATFGTVRVLDSSRFYSTYRA